MASKWKKLAGEDDAGQSSDVAGKRVTISITPKALGLLGLLATLGVGGYFTAPYLIEHVSIPFLHCERLDRRCQRATQSGSNLAGATVCGLTGLLTLGGRTQEQCRAANEVLDDLSEGKRQKAEAKPKRAADNSEIVRAFLRQDGEALAILSLPDQDDVRTCQERNATEILSTLSRHLTKLDLCIQDKQLRGTRLPELISLEFAVQPNGRATKVAIADRGFRAGSLERCVTRALKDAPFRQAKGGLCPVSVPIKISGR